MRENEFEKRVQQKMGDFNLHPSEDVWAAVERRIRKEKKRRILAWWPLFFLLGGGGIAAGILLTNKKEKIITVNKQTPLPTKPALEKTNVPEHVNNSTNTQHSDTAISKNTAQLVKSNSADIKITAESDAAPVKLTKQTKEKKIIPIILRKEKKQNSPDDIVTTDKQNKNQQPSPPVTTIVASKPPLPSNESDKMNDIAVVTKQETVENIKKQEKISEPADSALKTATTKKADKKKNNWDWGISLSAGRSSIGNGFSLSNQRLFFDATALQSTTPVNNFSNNVSLVRPSFSWSAGLFIKREVSKRLDFNAGFGYSYLSTKMNIGSRVDSARLINNYYTQGLTVNNFYRPGGNSMHTNGYHFISLSADLSWRVLNGKKVKIYWENGLSYNRMIGSSMLHYDRNLQGYYKDNSFLAKNQLAFTTSFSIPVSNRIQLSPFVAYNLTPVLKNSDTLHFTNFGIRLKFLMNKK